MSVKSNEFLSEFSNHLNFIQENLVKITYIVFDVTLRLINRMQKVHIFSRNVNYVINVLSMTLNQFFFLLENYFDQTFMVFTDSFCVFTVLLLTFFVRLDRDLFQISHLWGDNYNSLRISLRLLSCKRSGVLWEHIHWFSLLDLLTLLIKLVLLLLKLLELLWVLLGLLLQWNGYRCWIYLLAHVRNSKRLGLLQRALRALLLFLYQMHRVILLALVCERINWLRCPTWLQCSLIKCNFSNIFVLSCKEKFSFLLGSLLWTRYFLFKLFYSICIPKCV